LSASARRTAALRASPSSDALSRRGFLGGLIAGLFASGCGGRPVSVADVPLAPLRTAALTDLLPLADLRWIVLVRPREIAAIPWLIPEIGLFAAEADLDRFAAYNAVDLRQIPEAAIASYAGKGGETLIWLARHKGDPLAVERAFRARLTAGEARSADRPDVARISGKIGVAASTLVVIGPDVVGFQPGGSARRGPAQIAALYAEDRLKKSPTVLAEEPLKSLCARFGSAPLRALSLGPFEGELARGARGLLAGATAIGAAARPSAREGIAVSVAVAGDFSRSGEPASRELADAWRDLANGSFGHLLGLDQPIEPPLATFSPDAVAVAVELDPRRLASGLAEATGDRVHAILR
jgi:hypothetical protein